MNKKYNFEYIVIGSGPAGSAAAISLAKAKKRVPLIEGRAFGGANINTRDIPYSVALNFAHTYAKTASAPEFRNQDLSFSLPTAIAHQSKVIANFRNNLQKSYESSGAIYLNGYANFIDQHTIAIGKEKFTSANFIIATGAKLKTLEIAGADRVKYLTPESAIRVRRLPKVVLVVGGGATGCEIATYFAELGSKVIIMESAKRLLPREDKEVSEAITSYLTRQLGVMVLPSYRVVALEQDRVHKRVIFHNANTEKAVRVDCIVLATGSQPNLTFGLENAKVKYKDTGIIVNKYFETSAKNIYAIGDCIGGESSTTRSEYEGSVLASNLINKTKNRISYRGFIRTTNTPLEVASIGASENELIRTKQKYKKSLIQLSETPFGTINNINCGFIKLLSDHNSHILGASIVAPNAPLIAEEIALAIRHNLTIIEIASTPHPVNSTNYAIKLAAKHLLNKKK